MQYFDEKLTKLNDELTQMGELCEDIISASIKTLFESDDDRTDLITKIDGIEDAINIKERDIEKLCMKLLLKYQPVASDFRAISSALKMISDMERIGDQAWEIAELSNHMKMSKIEDLSHIHTMSNEAIKMVTDSVESFVKKDYELAKSVIDYDVKVDTLFNAIKTELIARLSGNVPINESELYVDLLMTAKYLERIGDHAVNIGEWGCFYLTGKHVRKV